MGWKVVWRLGLKIGLLIIGNRLSAATNFSALAYLMAAPDLCSSDGREKSWEEYTLHRDWFQKFANGLNIKIDIVHKLQGLPLGFDTK